MTLIAKKRNLAVLLHVLAWGLLIILPQIIINRYWGNNQFVDWRFYINAAMYGFIFYINFLWLIPTFYFRKNKLPYWVLAALVIVVAYYITPLTHDLFHNPVREKVIAEMFDRLNNVEAPPRPPLREMKAYYMLLIGISITGFSIGLKLIEQQSANEKRQKELEKEKLNSELAFLKNQVSPHFFFNTLNNIYSLVEINTGDAQAAILKLSKMMRYLLYESESGEVQLSYEIDFMKHYIDLMQLRLSKKVDVDIEFPTKFTDHKIPPLLFIPFIENAFKHGISYRDKSYIRMNMKTMDNKISFFCSNSIGRTNEELDKNHSGIGLQNVKKRLNLLFHEEHVLNIEANDNSFTVSLDIGLNEKK